MASEKKQPTWTPRLRGKVYCSPACGAGCTKAAYDLAVERGNALKARLKGSDWQVVVHENMGWFYRVVSGPIQVYPHQPHDGNEMFWCMIGDTPKDNAGGAGIWTSDESARSFKDPNRAVRHALKFAREKVEQLNQTITAARNRAGL